MVGFANLGEIMASREDEPQAPQAPQVVAVPGKNAPAGHWGCYLWQTNPGSWQDVADALEQPFDVLYGLAMDYCWAVDFDWPLQKQVGERRVVREFIRGAP